MILVEGTATLANNKTGYDINIMQDLMTGTVYFELSGNIARYLGYNCLATFIKYHNLTNLPHKNIYFAMHDEALYLYQAHKLRRIHDLSGQLNPGEANTFYRFTKHQKEEEEEEGSHADMDSDI